jgi:elongation factor P hydroxylase
MSISRKTHHVDDLILLFDDCFYKTFHTRLIKGEDEPIYLPANEHRPYHAIYFAHGFYSSALHECAHWFIAGEQRRQQVDYGYWYAPDGRSIEQQKIFQQVEIKPQAIEWILSKAANHHFYVSIDNLQGESTDTIQFKEAITQQARQYIINGLPTRAETFRQALCRYYQTPIIQTIEEFTLEILS